MTVELIQELTVFVAPDGTQHETMDAACDHTERQDFIEFCRGGFGFPNIGREDGREIAEKILQHFKVARRG